MIGRRAFLVGAGAMWCGRALAFEPHGDSVWNLQRWPSPLAVRGDELARASVTGIEWWDTLAMKRIGRTPQGYRAICALADGWIVATNGHELHRFDAQRALTVLPGTEHPGGGMPLLMRAGSPSEVYLEAAGRIVGYRVADGQRVRVLSSVSFEPLTIGLGDGRIVFPWGETLRVIQADGTSSVKLTPLRKLIHLGAAGDGRLWSSMLTGKWTSQITLEDIEPGEEPALMWSIEGRAIHLASGPGGAVVLVMHGNGWRMMVVDESGAERWRADVPGKDLSNNHGFVALTEHRALLSVDDRLLAWDAATGAPIAPGK